MLGRKCVPERDRVPSLQCYGYPLEQEHGLLFLVGYLSDNYHYYYQYYYYYYYYYIIIVIINKVRRL